MESGNSMAKEKLIIGSGIKTNREYINLDISNCKGVDVVHDFNIYPFPFEDNQFSEIQIPNSIHCVENLSKFMDEIYRISKASAIIKITAVHFLSPINCQDPYFRTRIGYNTFDVFSTNNAHSSAQGISYDSQAIFRINKIKWIFSENKYLKWLSFIPNIFPKFYARFGYFYFPSNALEFELRCVK